MLHALTSNPFFGIFLSAIVYMIGQFLFRVSGKFFLCTPLFVAMVLGAVFLRVTGIDYQDYKKGGDIIMFFLTPATVAFAIPLYKMVKILKRYFFQIMLAIVAGSVLSIIVVAIIGHIFHLTNALIYSILPQAATTAIALPLSIEIGGIAPVTSYAVILNAVIVFATGSFFLGFLKINNPVAKGIAMGTSGHALGVAKSIELGPVEAAMASISVTVVGVVTVFIVPLCLSLLKYLAR